jgi:hypothetical protein
MYYGNLKAGYKAINAKAFGLKVDLSTDTEYPSMFEAIDILPMARRKLFTPNAPDQVYEGNSVGGYVVKAYDSEDRDMFLSTVVYKSYDEYEEAVTYKGSLQRALPCGYVSYLPADSFLFMDRHLTLYARTYYNSKLNKGPRKFCGSIVDYATDKYKLIRTTGHSYLSDLISMDYVRQIDKVGRFEKICMLHYHQAANLIVDLNAALVANTRGLNIGVYNGFILDFSDYLDGVHIPDNEEGFTGEYLQTHRNHIDKVVEVFRTYVNKLYSSKPVRIGITFRNKGLEGLSSALGMLTRSPDYFYCQAENYRTIDMIKSYTVANTKKLGLVAMGNATNYTKPIPIKLTRENITI